MIDYSVFRGSRCTLIDLTRIVTFYCRSATLKAPLVSDATSHLNLNRTQVENVYNSLLALEAAQGRAHCNTNQRMTGEVEADCHQAWTD